MNITVAIISYGYGHLVAQAIESVLSQTMAPGQILVVDDGANDGVFETADRYDGVNIIERNFNMGIINGFNDVLFNQVKTEKIMFLGADNWLRPDAIEMMASSRADITSCNMYLVGEGVKDLNLRENEKYCYSDGYWIRKFKNYDNIAHRIRRSNVIHGSAIYNVELARKVGGYEAKPNPKNIRLEEDWMLWRKMIEAGATHHNVCVPLLYYRRHKRNFLGIY